MADWIEEISAATGPAPPPLSPPALSPRFFGMARGEYIINDDPTPFDALDEALEGFEEHVSEVESAQESDHDDGNVIHMDTWKLPNSNRNDSESPAKRDPKRKRYVVDEAEEGEESLVDEAEDDDATGEPQVDEIRRKETGKEFSDADMAWVEETTKTIQKQKACLDVIDKALNHVAAMRGIVFQASEVDAGGSFSGVLSHRRKTMNDFAMAPKVTAKNLKIVIPCPSPVHTTTENASKKDNQVSTLNTLMDNALKHHLWDPVKAAKNAKRESQKHKKQRAVKPRT